MQVSQPSWRIRLGWPHVGHWDQPIPDDAVLLEWLAGWGVDDRALETMLVDNPAALFGFA